jgi:hypothetical protein
VLHLRLIPEFLSADLGGMWPGIILSFAKLKFELFIEDFVNKPCGAVVGALNAFEVREVFTSPLKAAPEALSSFITLSNAGNGFSEDTFAVRASESTFQNSELNSTSSNGLVLDFDPSSIVNGKTLSCTFWADLEVRFFGTFVASSEFITLPVGNDFKFWQENKFERRFPFGVHQSFLPKI